MTVIGHNFGIELLGDKLLKSQLYGIAAKTGIQAAQLSTRLAQEMVSLASARAPVGPTGNLKSSIRLTPGGLQSPVEVGRGLAYTAYAEFYITKGGLKMAPSGRFWYPSLAEVKQKLRSGNLDDITDSLLGG